MMDIPTSRAPVRRAHWMPSVKTAWLSGVPSSPARMVRNMGLTPAGVETRCYFALGQRERVWAAPWIMNR